MKNAVFALVAFSNVAGADLPTTTIEAVPTLSPKRQYLSTIQIAVHEPSLPLNQRAQRLVRRQFAAVFDAMPELEGRSYVVKNVGNELVFTVLTDEDVRSPMQQAVASMIRQLNGRTQAKGRFSFFNASLEADRILDVELDKTGKQIQSISAQAVPLRDLLREIRFQLGSLSYLIPGECADRPVDWSLGEEPTQIPRKPREVKGVMQDLGALFGLKVEERDGTFIFMGTCSEPKKPSRQRIPSPAREELLQSAFLPSPTEYPTQVFFPLTPIGE